MTFTYTRDIPDAPNNPSVDQGPMKTNTNSIDSIIAVDHYSFSGGPNSEPIAGRHRQVTISQKNAAGAQTDPSSAIYTADGTASTVAQLTYRNQNGIFPLSCVRAWVSFAGTAGLGAIVPIQSVNIAGVNKSATGTYQITPTANALTGTSLAVFVSVSRNPGNPTIAVVTNYSVSAGPVIDIKTAIPPSSDIDCSLVSVMIVQI